MTRPALHIPQPFPPNEQGLTDFQRQTTQAMREMAQGKLNAIGDVTLTAGTTTPLAYPFFNEETAIVLTPTNAAAAALSPQPWPSTRANKTMTLTHATAAGTETFTWVAFR